MGSPLSYYTFILTPRNMYLYTIPHTKLKARLSELIKNAFKCKNGKKRYEYIVVGHNSTYFVKNTSNAKYKYTEDDIVRMLDFLIDNIFVECGGVIFQQIIGIPMGTNCAPLLADLFFYILMRLNLFRHSSKVANDI